MNYNRIKMKTKDFPLSKKQLNIKSYLFTKKSLEVWNFMKKNIDHVDMGILFDIGIFKNNYILFVAVELKEAHMARD